MLTVKATLQYFEQLNGISFSWGGDFINQVGSVLFTITGKNVRGSINSKDGLFSIKPLGQELHVLVHIDQSKFLPCGSSRFRPNSTILKEKLKEVHFYKSQCHQGGRIL